MINQEYDKSILKWEISREKLVHCDMNVLSYDLQLDVLKHTVDPEVVVQSCRQIVFSDEFLCSNF